MQPRENSLSGWTFIAFPLAIIIVFTALPTVAGVALSLFEWSGGDSARFIGVENFHRILRDPTLGHALRNTLIFAAVNVPLTIALAFPIAVALHARWFVGRTLMRTLYFMPMVISIVAIGLIWRWVLEPSSAGILNQTLAGIANLPHTLATGISADFAQWLGVGTPVQVTWPNWLGNSAWGLGSVIVISTWRGVGFAIVLYLAAVGNVSQSQYDAAAVDGASPWQAMWRVTWPSVRPMTIFLLITGMIGALQVFDIVYVMIGQTEQSATDVLNLYLYREFNRSRLGYAATIGVVILTATIAVTFVQLAFLRRWGGERS